MEDLLGPTTKFPVYLPKDGKGERIDLFEGPKNPQMAESSLANEQIQAGPIYSLLTFPLAVSSQYLFDKFYSAELFAWRFHKIPQFRNYDLYLNTDVDVFLLYC